eukprot:CAMPEP_0113918500 /NCGR_PEP_ID=MMETSP0780_2-20120614/33392_1 /TAXON_ID=652834 /ORGANISM="Palpitomonas bilix" /LENGTH=261 /DNA_ID=CAMNT_0000918327 /DNA_START=179 /DNA_END=967 /DNA_ORIENTATION=+ /assembly_acc=CAM_ASM_000599
MASRFHAYRVSDESSDRALVLPRVFDAKDDNMTCIFLHGLGDSGHGWAPIAQRLQRDFPMMRAVLPHAPVRPVTLNMGMMMPAWFDLPELPTADGVGSSSVASSMLKMKLDGIELSITELEDIVKAEAEALPKKGDGEERALFVLGFSQGGAVALSALLRQGAQQWAGCMALSTWLPDQLAEEERERGVEEGAHVRKNVFIGHGREDPLVPFPLSYKTKELLAKLGFAPEHHGYAGMQHEVSLEEVSDITDFIKKAVPDKV